MAKPSIYGSWGGISSGKLDITNPVSGQGYCGENVTVTNFGAVSAPGGRTYFHYSFRSGNSCAVGMTESNTILLNSGESRSFDVPSISLDKSNPPESFSFVICASLTSVQWENNVTPVSRIGDEGFLGSDGHYYNIDGQQIFNELPSGVTLVSEPFENIFLGSDGHYYNRDGQQIFNELPSGVTLVSEPFENIFLGSDGHYYNRDGQQIFEELPSGVTLNSQYSEDYFVGSDGNLYNLDGEFVASNTDVANLPQDVKFVGWADSEHTIMLGSDGNYYNKQGEQVDYNPCNDLRSSGSTESLDISISGQFAGESYSQDYTMMFQPDINHTSGDINVFSNDGLRLEAIKNFYARFDNSISRVRGVGVVTVWAHLSGIHYDYIDDKFPMILPYNGKSRVLCQWRFDDSCCSYPTGFSDNSFDFIDESEQEEVTSCSIVFDKISWNGFERLVDFCCDDSDCAEYHGNDVDVKFPQDSDDGLDISCICDNLESINDKLDNLMCICDNLISLTSKIGDLIDVIEEKELSVTVNPSTAMVENTIEVNPTPITVNPSPVNPTIQVNPTPITVNPSPVNPTIQVNPTPITVSPCQPDVVVNQGDVNIDNSDLIEKLDELFKNDNDTITKVLDDTLKVTYQNDNGDVVTDGLTKVIKDKDFSNEVICEVEKVDWAYEGFGNIRIPNDN